MTLASTSNSARGQPAKRKKKPPACDACKARRVLCHRQPEGIPCPRCAEKGIICKTTPTQRGRPRRASEEIVPPSVSNELQPSSSGSNESPDQPVVTVRPRIELSDTSELPPELVKHLFDCLRHLPEYHHPLFHGDQLTIALTSVSWQIELLPPQLRVLASCACALSASISFHSTIIGPSNIESLTDRSTFFPGADLRMYGVRRAPVYRAFYERAFTLACETRIHIDVSDDNAASCFLLDVLERLNPATSQGASRPWAASYISHARILDGCREEEKLRQGPWGGFIMADALVAAARRTPPLFTYDDQLLLCGSEPPPLEQMLQSLKGMYSATKKKRSPVFSSTRPYMFHVTILARELYNKITGDYARRQPISETAVIQFLSSLSNLQSILALVLDQPELSANGDLFYERESPTFRREGHALRACVFVVSIGFTSLVLALHKELEHRASIDAPTSENRWLQERMGVLQRQVREMISLAAGDVARTLRVLPSLPHLAHFQYNSLQDWADLCLAEAAIMGSAEPARAEFFETFISAFKMLGYSCDIPRSTELIERMEAYVAQHPLSSSANSGLSQLFPFDNSWAGMFGLNQDDFMSYDTFGFM